jgi:hypothetical protein
MGRTENMDLDRENAYTFWMINLLGDNGKLGG